MFVRIFSILPREKGNLIGATNPNADTRNADIVKKISRRKGIFIRPNE